MNDMISTRLERVDINARLRSFGVDATRFDVCRQGGFIVLRGRSDEELERAAAILERTLHGRVHYIGGFRDQPGRILVC